MTAALPSPLTPLAGRVLAHVDAWTRAPGDEIVRTAGAALIEESGLDTAVVAIEGAVTAQHGTAAYDHYRGWLLDAACEQVGATDVDGEIHTVRSRVFLVMIQGSSAVLEDDELMEALAEDILTSFEPSATVPENLEFVPCAVNLGDLAEIGTEGIREILRRSRQAFADGGTTDWRGVAPALPNPAWQRSSPTLAHGERALIASAMR